MRTTANYARLTEQINDTLSPKGKGPWTKVGDLFFDLWSTIPPRYLGHEQVHTEFARLMEYVTIFQEYPSKRNKDAVLRTLDNLIRAMKNHDTHSLA